MSCVMTSALAAEILTAALKRASFWWTNVSASRFPAAIIAKSSARILTQANAKKINATTKSPRVKLPNSPYVHDAESLNVTTIRINSRRWSWLRYV